MAKKKIPDELNPKKLKTGWYKSWFLIKARGRYREFTKDELVYNGLVFWSEKYQHFLGVSENTLNWMLEGRKMDDENVSFDDLFVIKSPAHPHPYAKLEFVAEK